MARNGETSILTNDGVKLVFERHGRLGGPAVVLIHGWSGEPAAAPACCLLLRPHVWFPAAPPLAGSRHYFDLNARPLANAGCTVYTYDQRFHGDSGRPSWVRRPCSHGTRSAVVAAAFLPGTAFASCGLSPRRHDVLSERRKPRPRLKPSACSSVLAAQRRLLTAQLPCACLPCAPGLPCGAPGCRPARPAGAAGLARRDSGGSAAGGPAGRVVCLACRSACPFLCSSLGREACTCACSRRIATIIGVALVTWHPALLPAKPSPALPALAPASLASHLCPLASFRSGPAWAWR